MQMRNWFLIFMILIMTYLMYQNSQRTARYALRPSNLASIIR